MTTIYPKIKIILKLHLYNKLSLVFNYVIHYFKWSSKYEMIKMLYLVNFFFKFLVSPDK